VISSVAFVFVIVPCMAAVAVGAVMFDWRLAAAAVCGGLALALIAPTFPSPVGPVLFPVAIGVALGGLATLIGLWRRPSMNVWSRMIVALLVAFIATFLNLITYAGVA